jgi:hypothetical protein
MELLERCHLRHSYHCAGRWRRYYAVCDPAKGLEQRPIPKCLVLFRYRYINGIDNPTRYLARRRNGSQPTVMPYIAEILFLMIQVWVADYQSQQFDAGKSISHTLWAAIMGAIIVVAWYICGKNYWLIAALLIIRFVFFSILLNFMRHPRKPFFYLGSGGSVMDGILLKIQKAYPLLWSAMFLLLIFIQFRL